MVLFMPFGKHVGKPLEDVPSSYLAWLLRTCDLDDDLRRAVRNEMFVREHGRRPPQQADDQDTPRRYPPPANLPEIVNRWYREQAMLHHPDRGGRHEVMVAIMPPRTGWWNCWECDDADDR